MVEELTIASQVREIFLVSARKILLTTLKSLFVRDTGLEPMTFPV